MLTFHFRLPKGKEWVWRTKRIPSIAGVAVEWTLLAIWWLTLTSPIFHFGPEISTGGAEYFAQIQNQFQWNKFTTCGSCAFWNGNIDGGYPAFADPFSAWLHPSVIVSSLIFGARDGALAALIVTFLLAGIAQWWLARELGLGAVGRLWSGGMAIVAGRLATQLDQGMYVLLISTVAAWFVLPPLVRVARDARFRSAGMLGIALGCFLVAGQGYLQIGAALLSPLVLLLVFDSAKPFWLVMRRLVLAAGIALLLAAPYLVPLLHFLPSLGKYLDPDFKDTQAFIYLPLNFIIRDDMFFRTGSLGAPLYPYLSINYVGWVAVILGVVGNCVLVVRRRWWLWGFLTAWLVLSLWIASADPLRLASRHTQSIPKLWEFIVGIRNPAPIIGLAVPALLSLGAIGLDFLWRRAAHPRLGIRVQSRYSRLRGKLGIDLRWLLVPLTVLGLLDVRDFSSAWMTTTTLPTDVPAVLEALQSPGAEWVTPPYGELFWTGAALEQNMKLSGSYFKAWRWNGRESPIPELQAVRGDAPPDADVVGSVGDGINILAAPPGNEYAAIVHEDGSRTPCVASSQGGNIDVRCEAARPGILQVMENLKDGWSARVNGDDASISPIGQWMGVPVPAGASEITLRYRPWDVPVGLALMMVGIVLAAWCLFWADRRRDRTALVPLPLTALPSG